MQHRSRARSRVAVAGLLSLAGGLLALGTASPAQAGCLRASVWVYENQQGPEYVWGPEKCLVDDSSWHDTFHKKTNKETDTDQVPPGTPTGAGVEVWLSIPPN